LPTLDSWHFCHTPCCSMSVHTCWPSSLEAQAKSSRGNTTFYDIWVWVDPFLTLHEQTTMTSLNRLFHLGPTFGPLWFYRPWSPHQRRRWGFGLPSSGRSATHKEPSPYTALHFAWTFLDPQDQFLATKTCAEWYQYHQLHYKAVTTSLKPLRLL
jgi:hypothetical protein